MANFATPPSDTAAVRQREGCGGGDLLARVGRHVQPRSLSFRCLHFASRRDRSCHVLRCARSNPHHRAFPAPLPPLLDHSSIRVCFWMPCAFAAPRPSCPIIVASSEYRQRRSLAEHRARVVPVPAPLGAQSCNTARTVTHRACLCHHLSPTGRFASPV